MPLPTPSSSSLGRTFLTNYLYRHISISEEISLAMIWRREGCLRLKKGEVGLSNNKHITVS
jgi:hypothetical protein